MQADFTNRIKKQVQGYATLLLVSLYISSWTLPWVHKLTSMHGHPAVCLDSTIESAQVPEVPYAHDAQHCAICQNYTYNLSWYMDGLVQCPMQLRFQNRSISKRNVFVSVWQYQQKQPRAPPINDPIAKQTVPC